MARGASRGGAVARQPLVSIRAQATSLHGRVPQARLSDGDRGDVWIVDAAGGAPQNLTRGDDDGSGHCAPTWSPDAKRLALLSTRGGNVHEQGEQFFSALYRQGKRARFVRYWGEGHVFQSPANIQDMWRQIFGWFDEFLGVA